MDAQNVDVAVDAVTSTPQNGMLFTWLYLLAVCAIIYFFMWRPNKRRMAEYKKMLESIKVGNRVMAAGIYGTVKKVDEKTLDVEIAKGVVVTVSKGAVAGVE